MQKKLSFASGIFKALAKEDTLLRTQNVSEQNQKHFLYAGHKICVHNKCCVGGQTGKHLCLQQCVSRNQPKKIDRPCIEQVSPRNKFTAAPFSSNRLA